MCNPHSYKFQDFIIKSLPQIERSAHSRGRQIMGVFHYFRNSEIAQFELTILIDKHIWSFDVPVKNFIFMQVV